MGGAGGSGGGKIQVPDRPNKTEEKGTFYQPLVDDEATAPVRCGTDFPYARGSNLKAEI